MNGKNIIVIDLTEKEFKTPHFNPIAHHRFIKRTSIAFVKMVANDGYGIFDENASKKLMKSYSKFIDRAMRDLSKDRKGLMMDFGTYTSEQAQSIINCVSHIYDVCRYTVKPYVSDMDDMIGINFGYTDGWSYKMMIMLTILCSRIKEVATHPKTGMSGTVKLGPVITSKSRSAFGDKAFDFVTETIDNIIQQPITIKCRKSDDDILLDWHLANPMKGMLEQMRERLNHYMLNSLRSMNSTDSEDLDLDGLRELLEMMYNSDETDN